MREHARRSEGGKVQCGASVVTMLLRASARGRASTRKRFPAAPMGRGLGRGAWQDGGGTPRGATAGAPPHRSAQSGRTRAPILVALPLRFAPFPRVQASQVNSSKSSQVRIRVVLSVTSEDTLRGPEPSATLAGAPPAMRARSTSPSHSHFIDCGGAGPPDSPVTVLSGWSRCASPRLC